jgi:hypothetical protein
VSGLGRGLKPWLGPVCQAGRVLIALLLHALHRKRWPTSGTWTVSDRASTLKSAERLQLSHVATTAWTPFWRMFRSDMGGPGLLLIVGVRLLSAGLA